MSRVETMEIVRSAGGPGNAEEAREKGRAFGSGEAQAMQNSIGSAPNAMSAKLPVAEDRIAVDKVQALVDKLMKTENGAAKEMLASMNEREKIQVVKAFAKIYAVEEEYGKREKALGILCCTIGIYWDVVSEWRSRFQDTGMIRFTSSEAAHVRERFEHLCQTVKEAKESNSNIEINQRMR